MGKDAPVELLKAFETWQDAQRQALEMMLAADQPGTPADWAEGFRWLTRSMTLALEHVLEKGDPMFPVVFRSQDPWRKLIGDNPDVNYYFASFDPSQTYRLSGKRGNAPYIGFTLGTDIFRGKPKGKTGSLGQHYLHQFEVADNGEFEIFLGPGQREGNWIELVSTTNHLAVRETFPDRAKAVASELHFERVTEEKPPVAEPAAIAEALEATANHYLWIIRACLAGYAASGDKLNVMEGVSGRASVEAQESQVSSHSNPDMVYMSGRWRLGDGEALKIDIQPPPYDFVYWGLVIMNPWLESYDYFRSQTHLSHETAQKNADGSWTLVISPEDPGHPNWLDTSGRREGYAIIRWVLAGESPPTPQCQLVPIASLRKG